MMAAEPAESVDPRNASSYCRTTIRSSVRSSVPPADVAAENARAMPLLELEQVSPIPIRVMRFHICASTRTSHELKVGPAYSRACRSKLLLDTCACKI